MSHMITHSGIGHGHFERCVITKSYCGGNAFEINLSLEQKNFWIIYLRYMQAGDNEWGEPMMDPP